MKKPNPFAAKKAMPAVKAKAPAAKKAVAKMKKAVKGAPAFVDSEI